MTIFTKLRTLLPTAPQALPARGWDGMDYVSSEVEVGTTGALVRTETRRDPMTGLVLTRRATVPVHSMSMEQILARAEALLPE